MTLLIAAMAFYIVVWIVVWCILVAEWQREFPEDGPAGGYYWASFATNGVENFWSLLKRTLLGTYHSVDAEHLDRYLDEATYRFNNRQMNDGAKFGKALRQVGGRRLTYAELTGKG